MSRKKSNRTSRRESGGENTLQAVATAAAESWTEAASRLDDRIPRLFAVAGMLLGTLYAVVLPPMQVPDEMMHFARVYSVSRGVCVPSPDIDMPKSFEQLNELFPHWLELNWKISPEDILMALRIPLNDGDMAGNGRQRSLKGFINQNSYFCGPYLPEALVVFVGRHATVSPLVLMYLCRMTNLICYVGLTFLALRLLPDFRIVLACIALMPMSMQQAASVSADATVIAVSFLFAAYALRLAFAQPPEKLDIRDHLILAAMILFLAMSKGVVCLVALLILVPAASFPFPRSRWPTIAAYFLLAAGSVALWQHVNEPNVQRMAELNVVQGYDPAGSRQFIREHPVEFALILARCMTDPKYIYNSLQGFVGNLGWLAIQLPDWLVCLYSILLVAAAMTQTRSTRLSPAMRGVVLIYVFMAFGNALLPGWLGAIPGYVFKRPDMWEKLRIPFQSRYWIPFALPILVLFSTGRTRFNPLYFAIVAAGVVALASAVALLMIGGTYYS